MTNNEHNIPTLQDTVLTEHIILSEDGRDMGEKIYYILERNECLFINKKFLRVKKATIKILSMFSKYIINHYIYCVIQNLQGILCLKFWKFWMPYLTNNDFPQYVSFEAITLFRIYLSRNEKFKVLYTS